MRADDLALLGLPWETAQASHISESHYADSGSDDGCNESITSSPEHLIEHISAENDPPPLSLLYSSLVKASRRSLALALAQETGWLLLASDTCISTHSLELSRLNRPDVTKTLTFQCRWCVAGNFTIKAVVSQLPKMHLMSEILSLSVFKPDRQSPVFCLPISIWGNVRAVELNQRRFRSRRLRTYLDIVCKHLNLLGFSIDNDSPWLRIQVKPDHNSFRLDVDTEAIELGEGRQILWPASCCLSLTPQASKNHLNPSILEEGQIMDPCARAEAWYRGDAKGFKAHENPDKAEVAAQQMKTTKEAADRQASNALSPLELRSNLQDPSGVYPTPPDGPQSQTNNTPAHEDTDPTLKSQNIVIQESPYEYDNAEDHNMFEDNGMGLTEEDLEFFD